MTPHPESLADLVIPLTVVVCLMAVVVLQIYFDRGRWH
jgi:hypothetical protein